MTDLGNFPTGGAVTPDGRYYWTVSTGRGRNDIRIVNVHTKEVIQTVPIPGASGGIAMDRSRPLVYVSGVSDSDAGHADQQRPGLPGREGDVIHVFRYNAISGRATFQHLLAVPPPSGTPPPQNFPPTTTTAVSWPDRLAISRDGGTLLVPLNLADQRRDREHVDRRRALCRDRQLSVRGGDHARRPHRPRLERGEPGPCRSSTSPRARSSATSTLGHLTPPGGDRDRPAPARARTSRSRTPTGSRCSTSRRARSSGRCRPRARRPATARARSRST